MAFNLCQKLQTVAWTQANQTDDQFSLTLNQLHVDKTALTLEQVINWLMSASMDNFKEISQNL